jgi:hypothetical protein
LAISELNVVAAQPAERLKAKLDGCMNSFFKPCPLVSLKDKASWKYDPSERRVWSKRRINAHPPSTEFQHGYKKYRTIVRVKQELSYLTPQGTSHQLNRLHSTRP